MDSRNRERRPKRSRSRDNAVERRPKRSRSRGNAVERRPKRSRSRGNAVGRRPKRCRDRVNSVVLRSRSSVKTDLSTQASPTRSVVDSSNETRGKPSGKTAHAASKPMPGPPRQRSADLAAVAAKHEDTAGTVI